MKRLAPDFFDRRFSDLMEIGHSRLPGLAPDWTDYNAHDPGITLMELLAWVTEAQLYSLGRMRRDERAAYAALFGLTARGTEPARGLIWPDRVDPRAPASTYTRSIVIDADTVVSMFDAETPTFRPAAKFLWVPGSVRRLAARLADGRVVDYTVINERGGPAFQPFGASAGPNDVLVMAFECRGDDGLFPPKRADAEGALWPIGVRADKLLTGDVADPGALFAAPSDLQETSPLTATLVTPTERVPLRIASDSTGGLLRTGALLLDISAAKDSPTRFAIELRSARGFERPPRLVRIEPNVVPIVQGYSILDEVHEAPGNTDEPKGGAGLTDWSFQLNVPGLRFASSEPPVTIVQRDADTNRLTEWRPGRLAESGPNDSVYEFDTAAERVTFGNGVNGRIPPTGAMMLAGYAVCDGEQGGVAANRKWRMQGFAGSFGMNVDAVTGGAASTTSIDERREARRRARDHALVSSDDIVSAALHLPLLEVARAWVLTPGDKAPRRGTVNLVAMRARVSHLEAGGTPESRRWLEAIRGRLAPKMPLATKLVATAPRYVDFSIRAMIEVAASRDPATIKGHIERELTQHLALTGTDARHPGVPVSKRDLIAWIRVVNGVRRVTSLALLAASGGDTDEIKVPRNGLPRFDLAGSTIDVKRSAARAAT